MQLSKQATDLATRARALKDKGGIAVMTQGPALLDDVINLAEAMAKQIDKLTAFQDEV